MNMRSSGTNGCSIANVLRFWVGDVTGERDDEPEIERGARMLDRAGKAVHHAAQSGRTPVLANQSQHVIPCVSRCCPTAGSE